MEMSVIKHEEEVERKGIYFRSLHFHFRRNIANFQSYEVKIGE